MSSGDYDLRRSGSTMKRSGLRNELVKIFLTFLCSPFSLCSLPLSSSLYHSLLSSLTYWIMLYHELYT